MIFQTEIRRNHAGPLHARYGLDSFRSFPDVFARARVAPRRCCPGVSTPLHAACTRRGIRSRHTFTCPETSPQNTQTRIVRKRTRIRAAKSRSSTSVAVAIPDGNAWLFDLSSVRTPTPARPVGKRYCIYNLAGDRVVPAIRFHSNPTR